MFENREISKIELKQVLDDHRRWIETGGTEGKRADLSEANLQGVDLSGANLQKARFMKTNLKNAILYRANLSEAVLVDSNLQEAYLAHANLTSADLTSANLKSATIENASLNRSIFFNADLQNANLCNIEDLSKANLRNANLESAIGLMGNEFAGGDLTGTKLPYEIGEFRTLEIISVISVNARKLLFWMLVVCAYSWVVISTTTSERLILDKLTVPLPMIGVQNSTVFTYTIAPLILIGFFFYFQAYLRKLWESMASLPAIFPDGNRLDQIAYPWVLTSLVRRHFELLKGARPRITILEEWIAIFFAWWAIPFTLFGLWIGYLPRHDWILTIMHIITILLSVVFSILFYESARKSLKGFFVRKISLRRFDYFKNKLFLGSTVALLGTILLIISYGTIEGIRTKKLNPFDIKIIVPYFLQTLGFNPFVDLRETDISTKPAQYYNILDNGERINAVKGAYLKGKNLKYADLYRSFLVNAILRNANLEGAKLRKTNFQNSDIRGANLDKTDLRGANLKGTDLREATLKQADLTDAQLQSANLGLTVLHGADLNKANLEDADIRCADLTGVKNLTVDQLAAAKTVYQAKMDQTMLSQLKETFPHLLEKPSVQWVEPNQIKKCP